jgi:L-2-hydroxyglutarate oxidase
VDECGKVIVATSAQERQRLNDLLARGVANGVPGLEQIGPERLREIEPHAAGLGAIHSPHTAIVDYHAVARAIAGDLRRHGVVFQTGAPVTAIADRADALVIHTARGDHQARYLVNCAGLQADVVARAAGAAPTVGIIPFRGEYYFLRPERRHLVRGLIYPVPDPAFPFLGVHFTRTVHGEVEAGPNAVLALAREGYSWRRISPADMVAALTFPGFWRMARRYWRTGLYEVQRSLNKGTFVRSLQRLLPAIQDADVVRGGSGVRAQAVTTDGLLADDFQIIESARAMHVLNAPSPAATASLAIGRHVAGLVASAPGAR